LAFSLEQKKILFCPRKQTNKPGTLLLPLVVVVTTAPKASSFLAENRRPLGPFCYLLGYLLTVCTSVPPPVVWSKEDTRILFLNLFRACIPNLAAPKSLPLSLKPELLLLIYHIFMCLFLFFVFFPPIRVWRNEIIYAESKLLI
jgi:hypothetical protein